jgi:hypothetical protein
MDTNNENVKRCTKCGEIKENNKFIKNRNICKVCHNANARANYNKINNIVLNTNIKINVNNEDEATKKCNICNQTKSLSDIVKNRVICKDCNNLNRRNKYHTDDEVRIKIIKQASDFKHNKAVERQQKKLEEIGEDNKKCSICSTIKNKCNFRHNRLKCRNCERDEPIAKLKRVVRARIYAALTNKKLHTIEYLGCSSQFYLQWILNYNENYTLDNRGTEWHIDHVIPLSHFDLENIDEQMIAFNWRNTMPLEAKENLSKNCKIIKPQIEQHMKYLSEYHTENNIEFPKIFIDLFAKHLDAGTPLEPLLPL